MATIVLHKPSNTRFVLVGSGYGMSESATPGIFLGDLDPRVHRSSLALLALCSSDGEVGWYRSTECQVVEIDGHPALHYVGDSKQL